MTASDSRDGVDANRIVCRDGDGDDQSDDAMRRQDHVHPISSRRLRTNDRDDINNAKEQGNGDFQRKT